MSAAVAPSRLVALCDARGIAAERVLSRSRDQRSVAVRQAIMRDLYRQGFGLKAIGRAMQRHHTTVLHAVRRGQ